MQIYAEKGVFNFGMQIGWFNFFEADDYNSTTIT